MYSSSVTIKQAAKKKRTITIDPKYRNSYKSIPDVRGIRYELEPTHYGVKARRRSTAEVKEAMAEAINALPEKVKQLINVVYDGCNRNQIMFYSQETMGKLVHRGRDWACVHLGFLHHKGWFAKRRRYSLPGSKWLSCDYKLPIFALMVSVRLFLSSLIPALGDSIPWHATLCSNSHVNEKLIFASSNYLYSRKLLQETGGDCKGGERPPPQPPNTSDIQKSEKALQRLSTLRQQLPLQRLHCHESKRPMTFAKVGDYLPTADSGATERVAPSSEVKRVAQQADFNQLRLQHFLERAGINLAGLINPDSEVRVEPPPTPPAPSSKYDELMRKRAQNAMNLSRAKFANIDPELIAKLEEEKQLLIQQIANARSL